MIYAVISCRNKVGRLICFSRNARGVINLHSRPVQVEGKGERRHHRGRERKRTKRDREGRINSRRWPRPRPSRTSSLIIIVELTKASRGGIIKSRRDRKSLLFAWLSADSPASVFYFFRQWKSTVSLSPTGCSTNSLNIVLAAGNGGNKSSLMLARFATIPRNSCFRFSLPLGRLRGCRINYLNRRNQLVPGTMALSRGRASGFSTRPERFVSTSLSGSWQGSWGRRRAVRTGERNGYQFDSDAVKRGRRRARWRGEEGNSRDGAEKGVQFPSSRGRRAAHTLPFGAVTPTRVMVAEWVAGAGQTSHNLLLLLSFRCSFPGCL